MLSHLVDLDLYLNSLSRAIPTELGYLTKMEELDLGYNKVTGTMPEELCSLFSSGKLKKLWADCHEVECSCCTHCCVDGDVCNKHD